MVYRIVFLLLSLLLTCVAQALTEGRLLSQSTTGRTVVFNLGLHDGMKEGDYAVIVKQIRKHGVKDLRYIPAAKARIVKVNVDSSIWILYHVYDGELLINGQKFVLLTETNMLRGQRKLKIGRTTVVAPKDKVNEVAKDAVSDDRKRLAKLEDRYLPVARPNDPKMKSNNDFELIDLEDWEGAKGDRYRSSLYKSPHRDEFRRNYRLEAFQSIVGAYLEQVNDPDFEYDKFYAQQMRDGFSNEFRQKSNFNTEYEDFLHKQSIKRTEDARIYRSILEKGESWSEDFSDEELRRVLSNVSVLQEQDRRITVVSKPVRFAFFFDYGFIVNDSQSDKDPNYRRDRLYEIAGEFEMVPFLKHPTLEHFTFNVGARSTSSAYDNDGTNVDFDVLSMNLGANWYPVYSPYTVKAPLFFLGTFVRSGYATVESPVTNQGAKYTVFSFPGFRAGLRYIFRNKVGLRIVGSMESLKLERYEINTFGSDLPESDSLVEGKMAVGLSYSF